MRWTFAGIIIAILIGFFVNSETYYYTITFPILGILTFHAIRYPEITLGLFLTISYFKHDAKLSFLGPIDLTVLMAVLIVFAMLFKIFFPKDTVRIAFPRAFMFYIPFLLMMLISLVYTPHLAIGLDKTGRFLVLTGVAIVAPFIIFDSSDKFHKFFLTLVIMGILVNLNTRIGGHGRFVSLSGHAIQIGESAAVSIVVMLYYIIPNSSIIKSITYYFFILILITTLVGSGARSATIALSLCLIISLFLYRRYIVSFVCLAVIGIYMISMSNIPLESYEYLLTIFTRSTHDLLSFRGELMKLGFNLTMEYPIFGVGIGGYPFYSPDPALYNWPHNVFLEISSEMGILSALSIGGLILCAFWEAIRQIVNTEGHLRHISCAVFGLLVIGFITISNTGDINEVRPMWFYVSLPFVIRGLRLSEADTHAHADKPFNSMYREAGLGLRAV